MSNGGNCPTCTPFWARLQHTSDQSRGNTAGYNCTIGTVQRLECRVEVDPETSQRTQRCYRTIKRFRECPGRPAELLESSVEESRRAPGEGNGELFSPSGLDVLDNNMGDAVEEILKMAAEMSRALEDEHDLHPAQELPPSSKVDGNGHHSDKGLQSWMRALGLGRGRTPGDTSGAGAKDDKLWKEFASKFEEV